jgi:pyridinium-3,5-bisthiocarboxylic acid mononucleotide nickel chelatase
MTIAHLDCFSGISGDMMLGALVDAGVEIEALSGMLGGLDLQGWRLELDPETHDHRVPATSIHVACPHEHHHRTFGDIRSMIEAADLPAPVAQRSVAVFQRLAEAEGLVHGRPAEEVTFHEVGAVDSIVDIVGAVAGLHMLGIQRLTCGPVPLGGGTVRCQHGLIPVPAPATVELLKGVPTWPGEDARELTTPTGAALVATLAAGFGPMPAMTVGRVGYGLGKARGEALPNALRIFVGEPPADSRGIPQDVTLLLETNLDDLSPQFFGPLLQKLLDAGAQDAFLTPVQMKKGRPGVQISVLCPPQLRADMEDILFHETTTIGVRRQRLWRSCLVRRFRTVATPYGEVRIKESLAADEVVNRMPEFEDCRTLAEQHGVSVLAVHDAARAALDHGEPG